MSNHVPSQSFESRNSHNSAECNEDSDSDPDQCEYYNVPNITAPGRPPVERQERPEAMGSPGASQRPKPPPRRRSNNNARSQNVPCPSTIQNSMSENLPGQSVDNLCYEANNITVREHNGPSHQSRNKGMDDLKNCPWYWGDISRGDAEQMLKNCQDGSFLVRDSTTPGDYTLTVRKDGQSKCLKVYQNDGRFGLKVNESNFDSLMALIEHYRLNTLADFNRRLDTTLTSCPSKKKGKKAGNRYESLSTLADFGRQLQKAKQQYVELREKQVNSSQDLNVSQIRQRAFTLSNTMFSELLAPHPSNDDVNQSEDRQRMLENNKRLARERQATVKHIAERFSKQAERCEGIFNHATIALNNHVEKLRDIEENCAKISEMLLEDGAKKELIDCLVEEATVPYHNQSLWLVDCSRDEAIELLQTEPVGTFLIRPRDEVIKPYALSIVVGNEDGSTVVKHCFIHHPTGCGYGFRDDGAVFESIDELVCKHSRTSIKIYFAKMDTCLVHPINRQRPMSTGELSSDDDYLFVVDTHNT